MTEQLEEFDKYINDLIFVACDGKPTEMEALERQTGVEFFAILDKHVERVERHNKNNPLPKDRKLRNG